MSRFGRGRKSQKMSPEDYMKKYHSEVNKNRRDILSRFKIPLPDEFVELSPSEAAAYRDGAQERFFQLTKEYQGRDEDVIANDPRYQFIEEDDWASIRSGGPMAIEETVVKHFPGKGYLLEFVREGYSVSLNMYIKGMMEERTDVFETLCSLMSNIVPKGPRMNTLVTFEDGVEPRGQTSVEERKERTVRGDTYSCYVVKFRESVTDGYAQNIVERVTKKFLKDFVMPRHFPLNSGKW